MNLDCPRVGLYDAFPFFRIRWQNGRVERHGGWVKERLEIELQTGTLGLKDWKEVSSLLVDLVAAKNQFLNRGGYSPVQLVFGRTPQIPGELLQEEQDL